ncbi:Uncharacterised protein [Candidatus Gugararchaeum adminiculabundum]|nr:Uncharacterised protein [Candidatus Gugararchaeum adminiculabundum]
METLIKLEGVPEEVLLLLLEEGYFKTKTEAIRAGLLGLGKEYNLLKSPEELEERLVAMKVKRLEEETKAGKGKVLSEEEVRKKYGFKE